MPLRFQRTGLCITLLLVCAGVCGAVPFSYSISCSQLTVGPDTILPYTQNGTVDLTPNVSTTNDTIDFFNGTTQINRNDANATFNSTLPCSFTLGGVVTLVNRPFQLAVIATGLSGAGSAGTKRPTGILLGSETQTFTFQALSFTVNIPGQGTVAVSQSAQLVLGNFTPQDGLSLPLVTPPIASTLLFTPLQPAGVPLPPSILLTFTGLAGAGVYEVRRRRMLALRR